MKGYAQNDEDLIIKEYFDKQGISQGVVLDIGANDGVTFSNSKLFIENGWQGHLIEPSSVFQQICDLYNENENVFFYNFGIGLTDSEVKFYESGSVLEHRQDSNLVSSAIPTERWLKETTFIEKEVPFLSFETFLTTYFQETIPIFDFISIDAEGLDWEILQQIDLDLHETKCVCVEFNGNHSFDLLMTKYCNNFGLYEEARNEENIIFVR